MGEGKNMAFVFHPFRLDPDQRLLSRDGEPVLLTPKEFDTLLVLVEANGKVIHKEELISRVWPDSYVGDGSLARNVSVLRKALGNRVIETLPRRGYRIALPIQRERNTGDSSEVDSAPQLPKPTAKYGGERGLSAVPWFKRRIVIAATAGLTVVFASMVVHLFLVHSAGAGSRHTQPNAISSLLVQQKGGTDPLDAGFATHVYGRFEGVPVRNLANYGWDRWRVTSSDRGYYYRSLSAAEKEFALEHDWKLTCVCALEQGGAHVNIDFGKIDFGKDGGVPRFDIELLQEGNRYFVGLTRQISPEIQWDAKIEFPGVADTEHLHAFELRYDHNTRTASLWIDGQRKFSGYRGHYQFREDRGLIFGAAAYLGVNPSIGVFRSVSFEAN